MDYRFFNAFASIGCSTFVIGIVILIWLFIKGQFGLGIITCIVISIASFVLFIIGHENLLKNKKNYKKYIATFQGDGEPLNEIRVFEPDSLLSRLVISEEQIDIWEPLDKSEKKPLKNLPFIVSRYHYSEIEKVEMYINKELVTSFPIHSDGILIISEPEQITELQLNIRASGNLHELLFYQLDAELLHNPLKKNSQIYSEQLGLIKECFFLIRDIIEISTSHTRSIGNKDEMKRDAIRRLKGVIQEVQQKQKKLELVKNEGLHQGQELRFYQELEEEESKYESNGQSEKENKQLTEQLEEDTFSDFEKFLELNKQKQFVRIKKKE